MELIFDLKNILLAGSGLEFANFTEKADNIDDEITAIIQSVLPSVDQISAVLVE